MQYGLSPTSTARPLVRTSSTNERSPTAAGDLDVVFVGGGFSATMTLVHLIRELSGAAPLRIAMLDRDGEFGGGVPYGSLADPMFLLNENVATMNVSGLLDWLSVHRERWLGLLEAKHSPGVMNWLSINARALRAARANPASYLPLHIPRCIFGLFVCEVLQATIADARKASVASVDLVRGDAITICSVDPPKPL
jgi:uncharacterized NAD(P)/FAD-binding protein YdhS